MCEDHHRLVGSRIEAGLMAIVSVSVDPSKSADAADKFELTEQFQSRNPHLRSTTEPASASAKSRSRAKVRFLVTTPSDAAY